MNGGGGGGIGIGAEAIKQTGLQVSARGQGGSAMLLLLYETKKVGLIAGLKEEEGVANKKGQ